MDEAGGGEGRGEGRVGAGAATFGGRLAGARGAAGLDGPDLARRLGVRAATLRAWEEDRSVPRANRVSTLAGILGVPLVWLMSGEGAGAAPRAVPDGDLLEEVARARADAARATERLGAIEARLRRDAGTGA